MSEPLEMTDRDGRRYPIEDSDCLDDKTERRMTRLAFGPDVPKATKKLRARIRQLIREAMEATLPTPEEARLLADVATSQDYLCHEHPVAKSALEKLRRLSSDSETGDTE